MSIVVRTGWKYMTFFARECNFMNELLFCSVNRQITCISLMISASLQLTLYFLNMYKLFNKTGNCLA